MEGEAAAAGAVLPVGRRLEALKVAERTVEQEKTSWQAMIEGVTDPFFRSTTTEQASRPAEEPRTPAKPERSAEEVLAAVAPQITPTGTMLIGSEHYLLIAGRRYKVGDQISVTFEELVYEVRIASIERNSYTLQLNDNELRRDFK
ncbi:MAG: hypothetical protein ACREIA_24375 [Opitutaceae bacterium]